MSAYTPQDVHLFNVAIDVTPRSPGQDQVSFTFYNERGERVGRTHSVKSVDSAVREIEEFFM